MRWVVRNLRDNRARAYPNRRVHRVVTAAELVAALTFAARAVSGSSWPWGRSLDWALACIFAVNGVVQLYFGSGPRTAIGADQPKQ